MHVLDGWLLPAPQTDAARPRIVAIGGDGIGPVVTDAALACLEATGAAVDVARPVHGQAAIDAGGAAFPDETREAIDGANAVLFGAAGPTSVSILRYLRYELGTYACLRPSVTLPLADLPWVRDDVNLVIVRELSEGLYLGVEGELSALTERMPALRDRFGRPLPAAGRFAMRVVTEEASRRIARRAAELAAHRAAAGLGPGKVTVVTKQNVLRQTDELFRRVAEEEIAHQEGLRVDHLYVDEAARRLVSQPERFDVILTTNLFGDVLSDVAAEVTGGLPCSPSACVGERFAYFEPVHGSAPDLEDPEHANPVGAILSAAMMLRYLGQSGAGEAIVDATLAVLRDDEVRTFDRGGDRGARHVAEAIVRRIAQAQRS